ncbi:MAG: glycosyltransferase [Candidatus Limnocylindria bacterium]
MPIVDRDPPAYVRTALESLRGQTYGPIDIHLMLSGPLPAELESVIAEVAPDPRVHLHRVAERRPVGVNLNALLDHTLGRYDYYARMDSDDEALLDRIAKQVAFMGANPHIDVLGGAVIDIDERGRELKRVRYPLTHDDIVRAFRKRTPMAHPTVLFRPSFFEKAGSYPARPLEDGLYWMRAIVRGCRFANLPDALVRLRRSDAMLLRRSGLRTNWEELKIRVTVNRTLGFGPAAYLYGLATFAAQMSPLWLKKILYDRLR